MRNFDIGYRYAEFGGRGPGLVWQKSRKNAKNESKNRFIVSDDHVPQSVKKILRRFRLLYKSLLIVQFQIPSSKRLGGVLLIRFSNYARKNRTRTKLGLMKAYLLHFRSAYATKVSYAINRLSHKMAEIE